MKKCPECKRPAEPSWIFCLFCDDEAREGWPRFPSRKALIIFFAVLLIVLAPLLILLMYMSYLGEMDLSFRKTADKQMESAVYFEEEEAGEQAK